MTASEADAAEALWRRLTVPEKERRKLLDTYRDAILHAAAEKQRAAIADLDLDDHWAVFYRSDDVEKLPDLIDPPEDP